MKFSSLLGITLLTALVLGSSSLVPTTAQGEQTGPRTVVLLKGNGVPMANPPIEGAVCFETTLYDAKSNRVIGTGIDCLENITPVGDGFLLDRTTIFNFPTGTLYAKGPTSVAPTTGGSPDYTHLVGDLPQEGRNSMVWGTRRFAGAEGAVRLSGAVNMSNFPDSVGFNCLFVIDLE